MSFKISLFIILAFIIVFFCGLIILTVQSTLRLSANDPQVQISESSANMLAEGVDITPYLPEQSSDISKSLATFIIVYNDAQEATISSAVLDGETPELPKGVLDFAMENGQNRVTWEPKAGIRIASVITKYDGGYVLAGRSLREVEYRKNMISIKVIEAGIVALLVTFLGVWFLIPKHKTN